MTSRHARGDGGRLRGTVLQGVLALIALFWLVPTFGLLIASLREEGDNSTNGWWNALRYPAQLTFANYATLLDNPAITGSLTNTLIITLSATLLVVGIAALAAYAFAFLKFPGHDWIFLAVVCLLVVPVQVALIPVAKLYGALGVFGSLAGVVLFHVAFGLPFAIFLLRDCFLEIPRQLIDAARLDGAGEWRIIARVVLPLGLPAIASLGIFQFLWVWNDLLVALVFADQSNQPITVALQSQVRQFGANIDVLAPGAFLSLLVPLAVFLLFQRFFVQGLMAGSVK
ncbi:carbohydrate ABC transporter permease [Acrocarpospora macrocephala]|uniref:carbohydrate ABC transporter permease n=1 Tax=Acrocarpospora macrocephala TaxID=150177 RepID=UPI0035A22C66